MFNEKDQVLDIINGFKNLTSKIKNENDKIKETVKIKDITISACKKEYQKLYQEHENLQKQYSMLEEYVKQQQQQQNQQLYQKPLQLQRRQSFQKIAKKHPEIIQKQNLKRKRHVLANDDNMMMMMIMSNKMMLMMNFMMQIILMKMKMMTNLII